MRKVRYVLAASLDNFIARADGSVDWLSIEGLDMADFADSFKSFDTVLMGRKTYEFARTHGGGAYPGMKTYVFSRTLQSDAGREVEVVSAGAGEFVRELKGGPGADIWLCGGGKLAAALLSEGLIDEVELTVYPLLLGSGIPFFSAIEHEVGLELKGSRTHPSGLVTLSYRINN